MLPIGDEPRDPLHTPWTTYLLLASNALVACWTLFLQMTDPPAFQHLANGVGFQPGAPSMTDSFASMFLHAGLGHVLGNLWFLGIYGPNVERRLGRVPFLLLYLTAGLLGDLGHAVISVGSMIPTIGASGAISGILGAYLVFYPSNRIRFLGPFFVQFRLPAWLVLFAFFAWDNLLPYLLFGHASGIAHAVHLAGFAGGMLLAAGVGVASAGWGPAPDGPRARYEAAMRLWEQGMILDAHRAMSDLATGSGFWARSAADAVQRITADPSFDRASRVVGTRTPS